MKPKNISFCRPTKDIVNELLNYKKISLNLEHELSAKREELKEEIILEQNKGYEDGFTKGFEHAFNSLIDLSSLKEESLSNLNEFIFGLVKEVVEEVVAEELSINPESITKRISRALNELSDKSYTSLSQVTLKHAPEDQSLFDDQTKKELLKMIKIEPCESIEKGVAIIVTPFGSLQIDPQDHLKSIIKFLEKTILLPEKQAEAVTEKIDLLHHTWSENCKIH